MISRNIKFELEEKYNVSIIRKRNFINGLAIFIKISVKFCVSKLQYQHYFCQKAIITV